jgi:hypothetical protein
VHGASPAAWLTTCVSPPAVIVAVRSGPVFADTEYSIVPLTSVPVAPEVIDSHAASDVALHEHEASLIVIDTLPVPPDAGTLAVAGDRPVTVHSAWLTTCASPAIVTVATRSLPVFAATVIDTLPLPVPDIGSTSSQSTLSETLHPQVPALAVTDTLCVPPPAATLCDALDRLNVHGASPDACVTTCVSPPAVIVAVRSEPVLADTEYSIVPLASVPVAPAVIDSHDESDVALHEHEASLIVIDTLPVPPDAGTLAVAGDKAVTVHGADAASWLTSCVCPAIVRVALRAPPVFADTVIIALPLPVPDIGSTSIQSTLSVTLHEHVPTLAVTPTLCVPPEADTL